MVRLEQDGLHGGGPACSRPNPEQLALAFERNDNRAEAVRQSVGELTQRERLIVEKRLMADQPETYRSLGARMGISGERVKQLEVRLLRRLKAKLARRGVRCAGS
jgi:RNA polymerase sigma-32 factor